MTSTSVRGCRSSAPLGDCGRDPRCGAALPDAATPLALSRAQDAVSAEAWRRHIEAARREGVQVRPAARAQGCLGGASVQQRVMDARPHHQSPAAPRQGVDGLERVVRAALPPRSAGHGSTGSRGGSSSSLSSVATRRAGGAAASAADARPAGARAGGAQPLTAAATRPLMATSRQVPTGPARATERSPSRPAAPPRQRQRAADGAARALRGASRERGGLDASGGFALWSLHRYASHTHLGPLQTP
jgi:hypothetical protein